MKNNKSKNTVLVICMWILAVLAAGAVCFYSGINYLTSPVTRNTEKAVSEKIMVPSGSSVKSVASELKQKKIIRSENALYLSARFSVYGNGKPFSLKSGVYTVKNTMSLKEIYELLQSGEQEYISVSIPEGLTMRKISLILEDKGVCSAQDFLSACTDSDLLNEFNVSAESFEGYLFPDTYFLTPEMNGADVVRVFAETFFKRIQTLEISDAPLTPEKLHSLVTLASIVEREYRVESEAPLIASVFTNRIRRGIGLYSCATVEYVITEILGRPHPERITYDDLKIDSPYNTYKWAGLPPGPISNPGMVALSAAANPAKTKYYFFVLTDPETGTHTFTTSFDEHKAAENINYVSKKASK